MPDNIVPFRSASSTGRNAPASAEMYDLLSKIDELEDLLEALDEQGVTTRGELVALISRLETEAAARDASPPSRT